MTTMTKKPKLSHLAKEMVRQYELRTRGGAPWLTDGMRQAIVADTMCSLMLSQYGNESQSGQDKLIDAYREAMEHLGL